MKFESNANAMFETEPGNNILQLCCIHLAMLMTRDKNTA